MSKGHRLTLVVLFALVLFFLVFYAMVLFEPGAKRAEKIILNEPATAILSQPTITFIDPKRGNPNGRVTLVEFADYECPHCKETESVLRSLLAKNKELQIIWKDLPHATLRPQSVRAALAARCAGRQGKFWEYHDLLFKEAFLTDDIYPQLADSLGLAVGKFSACLEGRETAALVERNIEEAVGLGIDGVPYFFLNGVRLSGELTEEELGAAIQAAATASRGL